MCIIRAIYILYYILTTSNVLQIDKKVLECWSNPNKTGCAEKELEGKLDRLLKVYCSHSGPNNTYNEVSSAAICILRYYVYQSHRHWEVIIYIVIYIPCRMTIAISYLIFQPFPTMLLELYSWSSPYYYWRSVCYLSLRY